jgi:hypothetical protein
MVTSDTRSGQGEIKRMLQEAELYESQGLDTHALEVYRNVLAKEPGNRKARDKINQFQDSGLIRTSPDQPRPSPQDLSPRTALDLGLAYMGMNLYAEALEEFRKALRGAPAFRADICRHIAGCFIHLAKYEDANRFLVQVLSDRNLTDPQKDEIMNDAVVIYLQLGRLHQARGFLTGLSDDSKKRVRNYERLVQELDSLSKQTEDLEIVVEDEDTGEVYTITQRVEQLPSWDAVSRERGAPAGTPQSGPGRVGPQAIPGQPEARGGPAQTPEATPIGPSASPESQPSSAKGAPEPLYEIRFACLCGKVHETRKESVGSLWLCLECGRKMTVPATEIKKDRLTGEVLGKVIGGCRIQYRIGGGGMGGVFKGHHLGLDIPVAVKVLHAHLAEKDPIFVKRFIREARATAKLQHPNVVGVLNVGYEDGVHYLVMPFVGGGSAQARLEEMGRLPVNEVLDIALQVARALKLAEEHGITHRDVKPANILFTEKGEAKLSDLGLAKNYMDTADAGLTQTGIACGTPLYFSPEQARGARDLDIRSDIYSLGITLYHLIEGVPPFIADSAYVIFQKHVSEELPPFKSASPPVPEAVYKLIQKMTAKKREDRLQNAQELFDALELVRNQLKGTANGRHWRSLLERLGIIRSH